jgi:hypothetical protein
MDDDDDDDDDQIRPPPRNRPNTSAVDANTATVVATTPHLVVDDEQYTRMEIPDRATDSGHAIFGVLHDEGLIERYEIWKRKETMMRTRKERQLSLSSSSSSSSSPPPPSTSSKNAIFLTRDDGRVSVVAADDDDQDEETMSSNDDDNKNNNVIVAFVSFGNRLNGHVGIVHGGILSLVVDDLCGFAFEAIDVPHAVTVRESRHVKRVVDPEGFCGVPRLHARWPYMATSLLPPHFCFGLFVGFRFSCNPSR